jgi:hypothetical protein
VLSALVSLAKLCPTKSVRSSQVDARGSDLLGVAWKALAPQRDDSTLTCTYALRVMVDISRRSEWRRSL